MLCLLLVYLFVIHIPDCGVSGDNYKYNMDFSEVILALINSSFARPNMPQPDP